MIKFKLLNDDAILPKRQTEGSAGFDLHATCDGIVGNGFTTIIATGVAVEIPRGYVGLVKPRSGLAFRSGINTGAGVIDSDYRGEIKAILINHSTEDFTITRGMRIAQMVIAKYEHVQFHEVETIDDTQRGASGFGSTGK